MRSDVAFLILRAFAGLTMVLNHGLPKLMRFSELSPSFSDPLHIGSMASLILVLFAEVACAALLAVGYFTRFAAIPLVVCMGVAALIVHAADPFGTKELAFFYMITYLFFAFAGSGRLALKAD
jgi:putative oxidoreductase